MHFDSADKGVIEIRNEGNLDRHSSQLLVYNDLRLHSKNSKGAYEHYKFTPNALFLSQGENGLIFLLIMI